MITGISLAIEGPIDRAAASRILSTRNLPLNRNQVFITGGKEKLGAKIAAYNKAARHVPWLILRDLDRDASGCAAKLRQLLLEPSVQAEKMCLRIAVRSLEAWLLADSSAIARYFKVPEAKVPSNPEDLSNPKLELVNLCRRSRSADIRRAMVPPASSRWQVGPEYTARLVDFCTSHWDPESARMTAQSLNRALVEIDGLVARGAWR